MPQSEGKEEAIPIHRKRGLKSGKLRTAATSVLCKVVLPNKVVYMSTGKPDKYDQLSIPIFVTGYLTVMSVKKETLHPHMTQHL